MSDEIEDDLEDDLEDELEDELELIKVAEKRGITALDPKSQRSMVLTFLLLFLFVIRLVRHWPFRVP